MPASWPRNIVPHTEETLRALSTPAAIELYESSLDQPLVESDLAPAQRPLAEDLVKAGLFAREGGHLVRTSRHRRDPDGDVPGKVEHKRAILAYAAGLLDESEAALHTRGASATVMIGAASFADRPDVLARATGILAEAEDQLRALAEEHPARPGERSLRAMLLIGAR